MCIRDRDCTMIWTSTTKWYSTQHPRQHYLRETASTTHDLLQTLNLTTTWTSARHERQLYDGWNPKAFYNHYDARQHSSCETAFTMQDLFKNQMIFNIFEIFQLFQKPEPTSFSGYRIFTGLILSGSKDTYHSFSLTNSQLNPWTGSRARTTCCAR